MTDTATPTRRERARVIAERCADAYSFDRYNSWPEVARTLLAMGFTDAETEAVMRSKITRWAADWESKPYGHATAKAVAKFIRSDEAQRGARVRQEIREWAQEWTGDRD